MVLILRNGLSMRKLVLFNVLIFCLLLGLYLYFGDSEHAVSNCLQSDSIRKPYHIPYNGNVDISKCKEKRDNLDSLMANLTGQGIAPDNKELLTVLRRKVIDLPSTGLIKRSYPLFKTPQAKVVETLSRGLICGIATLPFKHYSCEQYLWYFFQRGGFFIECGALDGERSSNTLYLEQKFGWSGLLVEMDPSWYQQLRGKNRKSFSINACISPYQYPIKVNFKQHTGGHGKVMRTTVPGNSWAQPSEGLTQVYCFPIYSMMLALNQTHIDYFSLDVEGLELDILRTIPFDKLNITVFTVEYIHGKGGEKEYTKFMKSKGYFVHSKIEASKPEINFYAADLVFVKEDYVF